MPNYIERAQAYVPMLDEVYKLASCTSDMDGAQELVREGANAGELIIPMLEMDGLADYDRNEGYVGGSVSMRNATVKCNFERGLMFDVDALDNEETAGLAFGRLAGEMCIRYSTGRDDLRHERCDQRMVRRLFPPTACARARPMYAPGIYHCA